jgi:hypothetical protein
MEPKPVERNEQPAYPTRREVIAGAATFALANLAGCSFVFAEPEKGQITVAPIFEHGKGRGVTGCVAVSPPSFLSEEEGMQILREELAKHGIKLKAGGTLEGVRVPQRTTIREWVDKGNGQRESKESVAEVSTRTKPLKLDGMDSENRIAVEFVSEHDYFDRGGAFSASTVQRYDFKDVAEYLAAQVKKQGKDRVFFGVFYDPSPNSSDDEPSEGNKRADRDTAGEKPTEKGKKLLRKQAQDFVAWLKEQKAIK